MEKAREMERMTALFLWKRSKTKGMCIYMPTARKGDQNDNDEDDENEGASQQEWDTRFSRVGGHAADHKNQSVESQQIRRSN